MIDRDLMISALTTGGMVSAPLTPDEAAKLSDEALYKVFLKHERLEQRVSGADPYEQQKTAHGRFATFVWIGSALYLYSTSSTVGLFSVQAALFIVGGMFLAAFVFGMLAYGLQRAVGRVLMRLSSEPDASLAALIRGLGLVLMAIDAAAVFLAARWLFRILNGVSA